MQVEGDQIAMRLRYFNSRWRSILTIWTLFFLISTPTNAIQSCDTLKSLADLIQCAAFSEIGALEQMRSVETSQYLDELALQRPNPKFDSELWTRDTEGESSVAFSVKWLQPILRGGKLEAKSGVAMANQVIAEERYELVLIEGTRQALVKLYDIVRLQEEITYLKKMINSYKSVIKIYRDRQALSPESRVSVQVFTIAQQEASARLRQKVDAKLTQKTYFEQFGISQAILDKLLPSKWPDWPQLPIATPELLQTSPVIKLRQALVGLAEASLDVEKSKSYQDIAVGPMASVDQRRGVQSWGIGVAFSIVVPVYHENEAGISYAAEKLEQQRFLFAQQQAQLSRSYPQLIKRYQKLKNEVQDLPSDSWLSQARKQLERDAQKGLINASLIIEGHEQHLNITERRNELRKRLLEVLSGIYVINGHDLLEILP
jgi:outer membrane protein TolC